MNMHCFAENCLGSLLGAEDPPLPRVAGFEGAIPEVHKGSYWGVAMPSDFNSNCSAWRPKRAEVKTRPRCAFQAPMERSAVRS